MINYSSIATSNLRSYITYAMRLSNWDVLDFDGTIVALNGSKKSLFNFVFCNENCDEKLVERILCFLKQKNVDATWPVDSYMKKVRGILSRYRLIRADVPQKAVLSLKDYLIHHHDPDSPDLDFVKVDSAELLQKFDASTSVIFRHDVGLTSTFLRGLCDHIRENNQLKFFLVFLDGRVIGTCGMYICDGIAGFYSDGVMPEYRNVGFATHMVLKRIEMAISCGCQFAIAQCMVPSVNLYKRLGFKMFGNLFLYISRS